jgi:hypothetical protein
MTDERIRPPFEWQHPFKFSKKERKRRIRYYTYHKRKKK